MFVKIQIRKLIQIWSAAGTFLTLVTFATKHAELYGNGVFVPTLRRLLTVNFLSSVWNVYKSESIPYLNEINLWPEKIKDFQKFIEFKIIYYLAVLIFLRSLKSQ